MGWTSRIKSAADKYAGKGKDTTGHATGPGVGRPTGAGGPTGTGRTGGFGGMKPRGAGGNTHGEAGGIGGKIKRAMKKK